MHVRLSEENRGFRQGTAIVNQDGSAGIKPMDNNNNIAQGTKVLRLLAIISLVFSQNLPWDLLNVWGFSQLGTKGDFIMQISASLYYTYFVIAFTSYRKRGATWLQKYKWFRILVDGTSWLAAFLFYAFLFVIEGIIIALTYDGDVEEAKEQREQTLEDFKDSIKEIGSLRGDMRSICFIADVEIILIVIMFLALPGEGQATGVMRWIGNICSFITAFIGVVFTLPDVRSEHLLEKDDEQ